MFMYNTEVYHMQPKRIQQQVQDATTNHQFVPQMSPTGVWSNGFFHGPGLLNRSVTSRVTSGVSENVENPLPP